MNVTLPRHQCLIYDGAPSRQLPALAAAMCSRLQQGYRCLYLNSPPMVAGMKSYLAAIGVDVLGETGRGTLVLSSDQSHLVNGSFDAARMMQSLEDALCQAVQDGYVGLWATGDMTWEMGSPENFSQLLKYERLLEEFFHTHPQLSGICQYHATTVPSDALRQGLIAHPTIFVNETLSLLNAHYIQAEKFSPHMLEQAHLDTAVRTLCQNENVA